MTPLNHDQWQRVRDLFEAALDRDPAEGAAWVRGEAADDSAVRGEVLSLLDYHSRAGSFLSAPIVERAPELLTGEAEANALAPGAVVGSYTIVREIGRGGMGRVYLASDDKLGRTVALKALPPHLTRDPSHRERLRREARAAAALSHPGICTVYALEEMGDELFIASEFVDGRTLRDEIASGHVPSADTILATARELAAALASAHAKGITHRDLKPENVMRTADGRLKILDFGLARIDLGASTAPNAAMVTRPGILIGTPAYMAPEQINGQPADARTDVFALGVLLYEFVCGVHPFAASTELALLARVLESNARPVDERCAHVPTAVASAIDRCLRKAPVDRFASGAEVLGAINRDLDRRPARRSLAWWRTHQLAVMCLYVVASVVAWDIKESFAAALPLSMFLLLGIGAALGGIIRGHLMFTEWMNRPRLAGERHRTRRILAAVDLSMTAGLFADSLFVVAPARPLWAVLTMALGLGIALASLLMEPATTEAAFGGN